MFQIRKEEATMTTAIKTKKASKASKVVLDAAALFAKIVGVKSIPEAVNRYVLTRTLCSQYSKDKKAFEEAFIKSGQTTFESPDYIVSYHVGKGERKVLSKELLEKKFGIDALVDCYEDCDVTRWSIVKK